jgi:hypothetical protein
VSALSTGTVQSATHNAARTVGQSATLIAPPSGRRHSADQHARQQRDGLALPRFAHPRQSRLTQLDL